MSIYVYAPTIQPGTRELIQALGARRLVRHDGLHYLYKGVPVEFSPKDQIVCWGAHPPPVPDVRCLNANVKFPTLYTINTHGKQWLSAKGVTVFFNDHNASNSYTASIPQTGWWPTREPTTRRVAFKQLPGYVVPYHAFEKVGIISAFSGQLVGEAATNPLFSKILNELQLDFAEIYVGLHRAEPFILFIDTAPSLDAKGVETYTSFISTWAGASTTKTPEEI